MSHFNAGVRAIAVAFPETIRGNGYFEERHPDLVALAGSTARSMTPKPVDNERGERSHFFAEGNELIRQTFAGTVERRAVGAGESTQTLLLAAAREAISAAQLAASDIDAVMVSSSFSKALYPGDAIYLVDGLGLACPAWDVESTDSGAVLGLQSACALIQAGAYRNILIVVAAAYSQHTHEKDPLSFLLGDGGGAVVVGREQEERGLLGTYAINARETMGAVVNAFRTEPDGSVRTYLRSTRDLNSVFNDTLAPYLRTCCEGAMRAAGVTLEQIKFFCPVSPRAWYAKACARALGIPLERTMNLTPLYGHLGPASPIVNLYHAAQARKLTAGDLVLVYTFGLSGAAIAVVMRWGEVALGSTPAPPKDLTLRDEEGGARLDVYLTP
jgi:3-oxoacyl-[acyl-carrier-protein] synthase-3